MVDSITIIEDRHTLSRGLSRLQATIIEALNEYRILQINSIERTNPELAARIRRKEYFPDVMPTELLELTFRKYNANIIEYRQVYDQSKRQWKKKRRIANKGTVAFYRALRGLYQRGLLKETGIQVLYNFKDPMGPKEQELDNLKSGLFADLHMINAGKC